jgi:D-alanyl-lipoteichoic acid acyltransferase DltB (MBOAT superfamily)
LIFTSISYLLFLPFIVLAYYICPARFRWLWLVLASVAYYLSFIPVFFALIGVLVVGNYFGGRWLFRANERGNGKQALTLLVLLNIVVLAIFKYFNFFFPDFKVDLYFVDWFYRVDPINRMIIPLGLSYLVFTVLSYHFEIKRKNLEPIKSVVKYSLTTASDIVLKTINTSPPTPLRIGEGSTFTRLDSTYLKLNT